VKDPTVKVGGTGRPSVGPLAVAQRQWLRAGTAGVPHAYHQSLADDTRQRYVLLGTKRISPTRRLAGQETGARIA